MKIQNPHDKFFKETLGNVAVAKDFLNNYLPQSVMNIIDVDTLEPQKDSFINKKLQESFSDLLFKASINKREGYLYFLFEHKSQPSRDIAFQLLRYMVEIWNAKISKEETYELPVIIPLVVYHGQEGWNIKALGEMIPRYEELPRDVQAFIPDYKYLLYDLSRYTDREIKGEAQLRIFLTMLRDIYTKDSKGLVKSIFRAVEYLQELEDKETGVDYFETLIRYVFSAGKNLTKSDINEIIKRIETTYPEGSEKMVTIAEMFREEGKEEGIMKGMERGIEIGARKKEIDVVKRLAKMGLSMEQIIDAVDLPKKEVEKIVKEAIL
ncbi:Rpn family recombination-promoting nuclease/putative transposase [Desulfoscipio gibsoniae]|uniref:Transposase (putative) YhgA-like domain-containing protein n=1 Tax=Desulfoscipio gibsoniae DSM 7213 TaxID=767817 RepID=R4KLX0_9FIRM|nr:Rpn family recombination-promoting nuclease/putative transposase [Desulfoscipio gibsoniae]AGL03684.1 hypothetical protein Desgi_4449 [Desulfoscipio gibsoniae DSM 7213]